MCEEPGRANKRRKTEDKYDSNRELETDRWIMCWPGVRAVSVCLSRGG